MTRRWFVMACCALVTGTSMFAQSGGGKEGADPVSGTWTGELAPPEGVKVRLELKFDGKSKVSGTIAGFSNPGDVKTGTFDPKTGALKLQLGKKDDSAVLISLDGTVAKGQATGRVTGEVAGDFKLEKVEKKK